MGQDGRRGIKLIYPLRLGLGCGKLFLNTALKNDKKIRLLGSEKYGAAQDFCTLLYI